VPGPTVAALRIGGSIDPWRSAGFTVAADGRSRVGAVELRIGGPGQGLLGWTLTGEGDGDLDGIPTERTAHGGGGAFAPDQSPPHPNTALSVDHVVVRSSYPQATFAALTDAGMLLRGERVTGAADGRLRQGFFRHGEAIVEVVGPEPPLAPAPSALWGLTVTVADLDACAALLGERLGAIRPAVQPGRRIATVARETGLGVPLAVMSL
jgi:hypothetical protein